MTPKLNLVEVESLLLKKVRQRFGAPLKVSERLRYYSLYFLKIIAAL